MMLVRCDLTIAALMGAGGAFLGLAVGMLCSWLILEMVVQSWQAQSGDPTIRLPAPLNDASRVRALILYGIPLVFASLGAGTAYYLCMAGALQ
jgi:hypothetical protein